MHIGMYESFITSYCFSSAAKQIWSDEATLQAWLDVEVALAQAQAQLGMIPVDAAIKIHAKAQTYLFDKAKLAEQIAFTQHPLVPMLRQLEGLCGESAAGYIHWGATTQNILDTSAGLQMKQTHGLIVEALEKAMHSLAKTAAHHKGTPMAGRTHGQHALPTTFGFKLASWIDELHRHQTRLQERFPASFPTLMGGAIGTYGATGAPGQQVEKLVAQLLGLQANTFPSRSSFDRATDYCLSLGNLASTIEKIGSSVVLLMRTEIAEVSEAFHMGKIGSSTMAQKRNPNTAMSLIGLTRLFKSRVGLMLQTVNRMDEGDGAENFVTDVTLPEVGILALSMAELLAQLCAGLVGNTEALERNLAISQGLIASETAMMKMAQEIGRHEAHHILYEAAQRSHSEGIPYLQCIKEHAFFKTHAIPEDLASWLDPKNNLGLSVELTEAVLRRIGYTASNPLQTTAA